MDGRAAAAALKDVSRSLRELAEVPSRIARRAAEELQEAIEVQTASETDAYGRAWTSLASSTVKRKGNDQILRETGEMLDSLRVRPMSGSGLSITFDPPYTAFHQVGTKNMPARKVLPDAGLPESYELAIGRASREVFGEWSARSAR